MIWAVSVESDSSTAVRSSISSRSISHFSVFFMIPTLMIFVPTGWMGNLSYPL